MFAQWVTQKRTMLRDMRPCNLVEFYRRLGGSHCLHLQSQRVSCGGKQQENRRLPHLTVSHPRREYSNPVGAQIGSMWLFCTSGLGFSLCFIICLLTEASSWIPVDCCFSCNPLRHLKELQPVQFSFGRWQSLSWSSNSPRQPKASLSLSQEPVTGPHEPVQSSL